ARAAHELARARGPGRVHLAGGDRGHGDHGHRPAGAVQLAVHVHHGAEPGAGAGACDRGRARGTGPGGGHQPDGRARRRAHRRPAHRALALAGADRAQARPEPHRHAHPVRLHPLPGGRGSIARRAPGAPVRPAPGRLGSGPATEPGAGLMARRAAGLTLLEMLVVLIIAGMALAIGFQSLGQWRRADAAINGLNAQTRQATLARSWLESSVRALVPVEDEEFSGDATGFAGVTLQPLLDSQGGATPVTWKAVSSAGVVRL